MCGIRRTMRYLITVTENISLLLGRDRRHRKLWRREGGAGGVPTNTRGRAPRVPETSTAMSDDDEVTEEVLARLSREMAETVRVSLRQGEPEAVVDSQVAGEDDAPGPRTSAVSWSSRENPDDDDIMISALVSAMAKGREISASLGGGTDPVRVMVNLDAAEPPNPSGSRSSSVQRERVGFGSSAPRVTAPKVPSDADVTGPGLAYANVENLSRVSRPNAPGARWGKPPPRRPALAESLAPSSTRRAAARAVSAVTGAAHGTGGVAEAIADLEWVVRGEAGSSQPALVSPERLDVARRKPRAATFSKAGLRPVTPPGERARAQGGARGGGGGPQGARSPGAAPGREVQGRGANSGEVGEIFRAPDWPRRRRRVHVVVGRDGIGVRTRRRRGRVVERTVRHPNLRGGAQTHPEEGEETRSADRGRKGKRDGKRDKEEDQDGGVCVTRKTRAVQTRRTREGRDDDARR